MNLRFILVGIAACLLSLAGYVSAQSLAEVAKKEKQRRNRNKENGTQVKVVTDEELARVGPPVFSSTAVSSTTGQSALPPVAGEEPGPEEGEDDEESEVSAPTSIAADAPLRDKIAVFQQMVRAHLAEVEKIDEEIAKNNARITAIQDRLTTIGHSGLPTVPQVDRGQRYEGEHVALQQEQEQLRERNSELEAQKRAMADEIREKGRRAGVPAGYLRF